MARVINRRDLHGELARIDENLMRNELCVLEQGEHFLRRDEILKELGLRAQSGTNLKNMGTGDTVSPVKTTESIAKEVGLSELERQQVADTWEAAEGVLRKGMAWRKIVDPGPPGEAGRCLLT